MWWWGVRKPAPEDAEFVSDLRAAVRYQTLPLANLVVLLVVVAVTSFLIWASQAEVDEVTRGVGVVIPSSRTQLVQTPNPGVVVAIPVREGDRVTPGQTLIVLDDTELQVSTRELEKRLAGYAARMARLRAEALQTDMQMPPDITALVPDVAADEARSFEARRKALEARRRSTRDSLAALDRQARASRIEQERLRAILGGREPRFPAEWREHMPELVATAEQHLQRELARIRARQEALRVSLGFARDELGRTAELVDRGVVSVVERLRLERQVNEIAAQIDAYDRDLQADAARQLAAEERQELVYLNRQADIEGDLRMAETAMITTSAEELSRITAAYQEQRESRARLQYRREQMVLTSPVAGVIKRINLNTIGGVAQPGMPLVEIVPDDDTLLIEVRIPPAQIGFLKPGLDAAVKITAYDPSVFGGAAGRIESISADTIKEATGPEYFRVLVRTRHPFLDNHEHLPILPGMQAMVEFHTGRKTVLAYILKPFTKARLEALRER